MSKIHRQVIQQVMKTGFYEKSEFQKLVKSIQDKEQNSETMENLLLEINDQLKLYHMRIQTIVHPKTKLQYYGLINQVEDEISKLATHYDANELNYFKIIVSTITNSFLVGKYCTCRRRRYSSCWSRYFQSQGKINEWNQV